jgi:hypothetical protein
VEVRVKTTCTLLVGILLLGVPAFATTVIVGLPPDPLTGNQFPFGGLYDGEYQQVYTHSLFTGPITISNLEFYNTQFDSGSTMLGGATTTISLSTTSADWNTISATFAANIGANNTTVFSGDLSQAWAFGNTLHINLTTPFTYDPSMGNLLMDVFVSGSDSPIPVFFDTNGFNGGLFNGNTFFGRVYCPGGIDCGGTGTVNNGYGLVTGFSTGATVPEPGSLMLLGSGLIGVVGIMRRKLML